MATAEAALRDSKNTPALGVDANTPAKGALLPRPERAINPAVANGSAASSIVTRTRMSKLPVTACHPNPAASAVPPTSPPRAASSNAPASARMTVAPMASDPRLAGDNSDAKNATDAFAARGLAAAARSVTPLTVTV